jgi:hypothetical protein
MKTMKSEYQSPRVDVVTFATGVILSAASPAESGIISYGPGSAGSGTSGD